MEGEEVGHLEDLHASFEIFFSFSHIPKTSDQVRGQRSNNKKTNVSSVPRGKKKQRTSDCNI